MEQSARPLYFRPSHRSLSYFYDIWGGYLTHGLIPVVTGVAIDSSNSLQKGIMASLRCYAHEQAFKDLVHHNHA